MNLFDPQRPKINHRPAFSPAGRTIIHNLQLWPLPSGLVEISIMLPVKGEHNMGKISRAEIKPEKLPELIQQFTDDPETLVKNLFLFDPEDNFFISEPSDKQLARDLRNKRENSVPEQHSLLDLLESL